MYNEIHTLSVWISLYIQRAEPNGSARLNNFKENITLQDYLI